MSSAALKRQTAFRLDKELLFYLRRRAEAQNKSLNALVEDTLRKEVEADMEWPVVEGPIEISDEMKKWQLNLKFTPEELAADDRADGAESGQASPHLPFLFVGGGHLLYRAQKRIG